MGVADNIALVHRYYALGAAEQDSTRGPMFAPDAVWYVPGNNPVSGPYHGLDAMTFDMAARMRPMDDWKIKIVNVMGNGDMVVSVGFIQGERRGKKVDMLGGHVFRFDADGRIVEAWGFAGDQQTLDEFFSA